MGRNGYKYNSQISQAPQNYDTKAQDIREELKKSQIMCLSILPLSEPIIIKIQ